MSGFPSDLLALVVGAAGGFFAGRSFRRNGSAQLPRSEVEVERPRRDEPLERLISVLPVPALLVDRAGYVAFVNGAASDLFGTDQSSALGRALIEAIRSVELERLVSRALEGESTRGIVVMRGQEDERTIAVSALPVMGELGGVLVIAENRSEIARMERVRRDFLADISHELRTPISSIRLMVETIQLSNADPEAIRLFLPTVVVELERMTGMIEDLLDLARSESGQVRLRTSRVDLRRLVTDAVATFRPRAEELDVVLSLEPGEAVETEVDPERLTQVVVNLVDNALRHTPANGHVRVALSSVDGEALLVVEDDGVGIPFKDLPHVFERFYVVDRSRARGLSGTGLGLAIVKQIVEAHAGSIQADSELARWTRFVCRLPLRATAHAED